MREKIVINTGPVLALIAGTGSLRILQALYAAVLVPEDVAEEILGSRKQFGCREFADAEFLERVSCPRRTQTPWDSLDRGEAGVIQVALDHRIPLVVIDEAAGRRVAKLYGLRVTGSVGVLLRAKERGLIGSVRQAIDRMQEHGVWLGALLISEALRMAGEEEARG
jgi:predicted nucleic acid-binding protein